MFLGVLDTLSAGLLHLECFVDEVLLELFGLCFQFGYGDCILSFQLFY